MEQDPRGRERRWCHLQAWSVSRGLHGGSRQRRLAIFLFVESISRTTAVVFAGEYQTTLIPTSAPQHQLPSLWLGDNIYNGFVISFFSFPLLSVIFESIKRWLLVGSCFSLLLFYFSPNPTIFQKELYLRVEHTTTVFCRNFIEIVPWRMSA